VSELAIAIGLATLAGFAYALASVLQQRAAATQDAELSLRPGLLWRLARNRTWLAGSGADVSAYALEAAALGVGAIVIVQPVLVCGLLWALPLATVGKPERVTRREWIPAILLVTGLAVFVTVGSPEGGRDEAAVTSWLLVGAAVAVPVVVAVLASRSARPARRALLLAFAAGCIYGLTAALTKTTMGILEDGVTAPLLRWELYALLAVAGVGLLLNQSAFHAGHLAASLPAMAVTDPIIGCIIGVVLFGEELGATHPLAIGVAVAAIAVIIVATVSLARSPLVADEHSSTPTEPEAH
jgi:drug/metabolite transporter (DMT)-like permease